MIRASEKILERAGGAPRVDVVTIDMPISTLPITERREADRAVSRAFGARGCSTHSPTVARPGSMGRRLSKGFVAEGFSVATASTAPGSTPALLEVYPHPAILALLRIDYRLPYKVSRSNRFWPGATVAERVCHLLESFKRIDARLREEIDEIPRFLPTADAVPSLAHLKRYEDVLDALVCGWVGIRYVEGQAAPYGDESAAIWVPAAVATA